jgi:hypothetical protein
MGLRIGHPRPCGQPWSARGVASGTRLALSVALVLTATLGRAVTCLAEGLVIEAPNVAALPGSSGSFDLLLVNTNPAGGASFDVAADSIQLFLAGPASVTFTDASINTIVPYIYVTSGTTVPGGGPLSLDTFPNTGFTASDAEFAAPGFRTVNPGDTFGLAHVSFTVSPTAPLGTDTINFVSSATSLSDNNGNSIPFSLVSGSISVVPEPSALIEAGTAALIGLGAFWWRRGRRAAAR